MIASAAIFALLAAPPRVGVIAVGADSAAAGDLQRTIELRLSASPKVQVVPAPELIPVLLAPARGAGARPVDAAAAREAAALLQQATDAYYQDRAADALVKLDALAALHERAQLPVGDRVRALLWRTAVFLALKDDAQAEAEALAALALQPDVKVDLNEFKPSVKDAVDRVRARGYRTVTLVVSGLPAGATLELDDRPVTAPVKVSAGRHRLAARAPGRRDVTRTIDATGDLSVPMTLPFAMDPAIEASLNALVAAEYPTAAQRGAADTILQKAKLDWLVVAGAGAEPRVVLLAPNGGQHVSGVMLPGNLAAWVDQRVSATGSTSATSVVPTPAPTPVVTVATPRPVKTPRPPRTGSASSSALAIVADGGFAWTTRSRSLEGKDGGGFDTSFGGVGPRVSVDVSRGNPFARIDAAWTTYGISTLDVTLPDGSSAKVGGGTTTAARVHGGWRQPIGPATVHGTLGVSYEAHAAKDVPGDLGLLTGYSRTAIEAGAGARYPLAIAMQPALHAGLIVAPVSTWSETPANTTGRSPKGSPAFGWNAGVTLAPADRLSVTLDYAGAMRSVSFSGASDVPADPAIVDATISESFHSIGVTAGYRF